MQELAKQFHIACAQGDIGRYCILPGDPGRVPAIAALFDDAKQIAYNREFNVWTGTLLGSRCVRMHRKSAGHAKKSIRN